ncbi:MAG: hypothetical protein RL885_23130 [Planctomycetota bacterium]
MNDLEPESLGQSVKDALKEEGKRWLLWAMGGAAVGAIGLGLLGFQFAGLTGLGLGALIGAALGAVGGWLFYLWATTF